MLTLAKLHSKLAYCAAPQMHATYTLTCKFVSIVARRLKITENEIQNLQQKKQKASDDQSNIQETTGRYTTIAHWTAMQRSILSGSRAGCVNKFHPADLPQQNSKTTGTLNQYRKEKGSKTNMLGNGKVKWVRNKSTHTISRDFEKTQPLIHL